MIDQQDNALAEPLGQSVAHRCPHLGTKIDPETWFTFPADENQCHKASPIQPVSIEYQVSHCLAGQYGECPVYKSQQARWVGALPKPINKGQVTPFADLFNARNFLIAGGVIGLLALATFLAVMVLPRFLNATPNPQPTATVPVIEVTATPQPTVETPTPTATETVEITPTVATTVAVVENGSTPIPTREPIFASVEFDTNLRDGPSTESTVIGTIPGGSVFLVVGRDTLGVWLFVQIDELGQGWVFADQIEDEIEILSLPVVFVGSEPTMAPSPSP